MEFFEKLALGASVIVFIAVIYYRYKAKQKKRIKRYYGIKS